MQGETETKVTAGKNKGNCRHPYLIFLVASNPIRVHSHTWWLPRTNRDFNGSNKRLFHGKLAGKKF